MSYFDEMDNDKDYHLQSPGNVFHYQGGNTSPGKGADTSLNSYFAAPDFVHFFLDNRESMVLTTPDNLGKSLSKADNVFEIERHVGDVNPIARCRPELTRQIDRRYFIPALDTPDTSKMAEVHQDDVFPPGRRWYSKYSSS